MDAMQNSGLQAWEAEQREQSRKSCTEKTQKILITIQQPLPSARCRLWRLKFSTCQTEVVMLKFITHKGKS